MQERNKQLVLHQAVRLRLIPNKKNPIICWEVFFHSQYHLMVNIVVLLPLLIFSSSCLVTITKSCNPYHSFNSINKVCESEKRRTTNMFGSHLPTFVTWLGLMTYNTPLGVQEVLQAWYYKCCLFTECQTGTCDAFFECLHCITKGKNSFVLMGSGQHDMKLDHIKEQ